MKPTNTQNDQMRESYLSNLRLGVDAARKEALEAARRLRALEINLADATRQAYGN